jgi:hypothetical protein
MTVAIKDVGARDKPGHGEAFVDIAS